MEKQVQESINKFEQKKEFREVKLKTRQSFREDQAALDNRLSSFRSRVRRKMSADEQSSEADDKSDGTASMHSKLEDIVLDIQHERGHESDNLESVVDGEDTKTTTEKTPEIDVKDRNGESDKTQLNGHATRVYGTPVYENTYIPNGKVPGTVTLTQRPLAMGSMTPEPRLKTSGRRIYEKNPKLNAASTEHLDNVSVRSFKANPAQGLRVVEIKEQKNIVPAVPSLPVASIPPDGNLQHFNVDEMVTIFRMMNIDEEMLLRFSVNKVDGKRFAMFSDKDLETLGICTPIVRYFRDRSSHRRKKGTAFML